jgi:hypothetical protein
MSALFEARAAKERVIHLSEYVPNTFSRIEVPTIFLSYTLCESFCKPEFIIIKSNYFQNRRSRTSASEITQKAFALMREC